MRMDRRHIGAAAIILAAVLIAAVQFPVSGDTGIAAALAPASADTGARYTRVDSSTDTLAGITVERAIYDSDRSRTEITILRDTGAAFASRYATETLADLRSRYVSQEAPYAAVPQENVSCDDRYVPDLPANASTRSYTVYTLHSTDRYGLGACTADTATHTAHLLMVYCPSQGDLYRLTAHTPVGDPAPRVITTFRCPSDTENQFTQ